MQLTRPITELRGAKRVAVIATCTLAATTLCASALALRLNPVSTSAQPSLQEAPQAERPKSVHIKSDELKLVKKVNPVYPIEAKQKRIQGTVTLHAIISKDGIPMELTVESGPKELQRSALDAVRQWRYQSFLLNGEPIEVETKINVTYALAG